jgi:hypothetical protein
MRAVLVGYRAIANAPLRARSRGGTETGRKNGGPRENIRAKCAKNIRAKGIGPRKE